MPGVQGLLASFHFLRPEWLWALLPVVVLALLLARRQSAAVRWRRVIAPHLLEHLVVRPRRRGRVRPVHLLAVALALATIAAAGPSWRREPSPFTEDTAPLVIALDLSTSMQVQDVQPSRLERAKQKIRDLLPARQGARTSLLAYAGTAHTVLPLTDDPQVLESFVAALDPSVMPREGKSPGSALQLAATMLAAELAPGTILILTDEIPRGEIPTFAEHGDGSRDQVVVWAIGTEAGGIPTAGGELHGLDLAGLEALASESGAAIQRITVDDTDVERVLRRIETHLTAAQLDEEEGRWRDEGWWLTWPMALVVLVWFRQGWLVEWEV
jgi:Ca-activated chloride channel family protein